MDGMVEFMFVENITQLVCPCPEHKLIDYPFGEPEARACDALGELPFPTPLRDSQRIKGGKMKAFSENVRWMCANGLPRNLALLLTACDLIQDRPGVDDCIIAACLLIAVLCRFEFAKKKLVERFPDTPGS